MSSDDDLSLEELFPGPTKTSREASEYLRTHEIPATTFRDQALCAMFTRIQCACGHATLQPMGLFVNRLHMRRHPVQEYVRLDAAPTPLQADLPKESRVLDGATQICLRCALSKGYVVQV